MSYLYAFCDFFIGVLLFIPNHPFLELILLFINVLIFGFFVMRVLYA